MVNLTRARIVEMESKTFTAGSAGNVIHQCIKMQDDTNILGFLVELDLTGNATGSASGGPTARQLVGGLLSRVDHNSDFFFLKADGYGLANLYQHMYGKALLGTRALNTAVATGVNFKAFAWIPLSDIKAEDPSEQGIPAECFRGKTFDFSIPTTTAFTGGTITYTLTGSQTIRLYAMQEPRTHARDPYKHRIEFEDWGGQSLVLKRGTYSHMMLYKSDGSAFTLAQVSNVDLQFGGEPVYQNVRTQAIVAEFDRVNVAGGFESTNVEQEPPDTASWLPLLTPPDKYKISKLPDTPEDRDVTLQLTGSLTTPRVLYRIFERKGADAFEKAARAQGIKGGFTRRLKTLSKTAPPPESVLKDNPRLAAKWRNIAATIPGKLTPS